MEPITTSSNGITTSSSAERRRSSCMAMSTPPMATIGAEIMVVSAITTSIWICCTSLVLRVISEGAVNSLTSRSAKPWTRSKSDRRTSRPNLIAVRALK